MSALLPAAIYGLDVPAGDVAVAAVSAPEAPVAHPNLLTFYQDPEFPAAVSYIAFVLQNH